MSSCLPLILMALTAFLPLAGSASQVYKARIGGSPFIAR